MIILTTYRINPKILDPKMHYVHVNELKTLNLEIREESVSSGFLASTAKDLTGLSGTLIFKRHSDGEAFDRDLVIVDASDGLVSYTFVEADFDDFTVGSYSLCVQLKNISDELVFEEELTCCPPFEVKESCT